MLVQPLFPACSFRDGICWMWFCVGVEVLSWNDSVPFALLSGGYKSAGLKSARHDYPPFSSNATVRDPFSMIPPEAPLQVHASILLPFTRSICARVRSKKPFAFCLALPERLYGCLKGTP